MEHARRHLRSKAPPAALTASNRRLLVLEPDELTRWSITTYLGRWFDVETADCPESAERLVRERPYTALIVSDQLPRHVRDQIRGSATRRNPAVTTIQTSTGEADGDGLDQSLHLEKPFELASLARLLGIADHEIASS